MGGEINNSSLDIVEVINLDTNAVGTLPGPGLLSQCYLKTRI